ncbi:hypothetical protein D9758_014392 [Tetrapyrgos nigripes]|uniref:Uncharacterized protein n=1 Tax=Tetrapyrgos nigripes TaxID=182062 RepID=A0A8H5CRE8_9AGAR|nr:hypothetical protein D9758_014392 [Tetrapyrgos nigripes]
MASKRFIPSSLSTDHPYQGLALVRTIILAIEIKPMITNDFDMLGRGTMARVDILGTPILISFLAVNLLTNLFIPFMIAGRIWWIGRQVSKSIGKRKNSLTRRAIAICLESGMMYPLVLIPTLAWIGPDLIPVLTQVVGIAPTFIIVRVALGVSIENVEDTVAKEKEGNGGHQTRTLMTIFDDDASTGSSV